MAKEVEDKEVEVADAKDTAPTSPAAKPEVHDTPTPTHTHPFTQHTPIKSARDRTHTPPNARAPHIRIHAHPTTDTHTHTPTHTDRVLASCRGPVPVVYMMSLAHTPTN